ncbi:MAG: nucleotidyltransferase family protein [Acidobacteria bacterium]|nr:nucleotidyltransferase family protein [Acidobacteriota bacterium]
MRSGRDPIMSVAAIVLAAGASRRLGEPKQLVRLGDETLLERAVRACRDAACTPIVVVLGALSESIQNQCNLQDTVIVDNREWCEGMGSSLRAGVKALDPSVEGCVIVTCDMPAASAEHLRRLMKSGDVTASEYAGRRGVPAFFPQSSFVALMQVQGDTGARDLLKEANAIPLPAGELDVDTAQDLQRARELFG